MMDRDKPAIVCKNPWRRWYALKDFVVSRYTCSSFHVAFELCSSLDQYANVTR